MKIFSSKIGFSLKKILLYVLAIFFSLLYLFWRTFYTIPWHSSLVALTFSLLLLFCEYISNFTVYITLYLRYRAITIENTKISADDLPQLMKLKREHVPDVDIIIVTHNEDALLLKKTLNSAVRISYPNNKLHITVSDDGNRPEIAELAQKYSVNYIGLSNNHHAKSGNINNALKKLSSPYFAIFDADMIPFSTFLEVTVPYFIKSESGSVNSENYKSSTQNLPLGFIQTPQSFYNADIFQFNLFSEKLIPNEQDFFSRDINLLNNSTNSAIFTGSNALFLRQAVVDAGYFPVDTLTEDFELGARINMAGYRSYATATPQASGVTPTTMKEVIQQRQRWARGVIQSCRNLKLITNRKLSVISRLVLINAYLYWWSFFRRLVFIAAPTLYALFHIPFVKANFWLLMIFWAPGYLLLHELVGRMSSNIRDEQWGEIQETFFAPFLVIPVILESFGIKKQDFLVTNKSNLKSKTEKKYLIPYFILWLLLFISIIKFNYGKFGYEILMGSVITFWLLVHLLNITICLFIASNRSVVRKSERFKRSTLGNITLENGCSYKISTVDVSEGGILFKILNDENFEFLLDQQIKISLDIHGRSVFLNGNFVRKIENDNETLYSIALDSISQENDDFIFFIYDGPNTLLPVKQDFWVTPLDGLYIIVAQRITNLVMKIAKNIKIRKL